MPVTPNNVWEHDTHDAMQRALAGDWSREEYLRHREQLARELVDLFGLDGTQRGFEIGSGEGVVARGLAPHCKWLDCTDISRTFLAAAEKTCQAYQNLSFHLIETEFLDFLLPTAYDFGFSLNVFVHLNAYDIYFYLRSAHRLLRPGGEFVFNVVNIGESNRDLFRAQASEYRRHQDPVLARGLMAWHGIDLIKELVAESGFNFDEDRLRVDGGHYRVVVTREPR